MLSGMLTGIQFLNVEKKNFIEDRKRRISLKTRKDVFIEDKKG